MWIDVGVAGVQNTTPMYLDQETTRGARDLWQTTDLSMTELSVNLIDIPARRAKSQQIGPGVKFQLGPLINGV